MSTIHYTFISSAAILGVFCNDCGKNCHWGYSWPCSERAFWTKNKDRILCPACAKLHPMEVYRRVFEYHDIPSYRSVFRTNCRDDQYMFHDDAANKSTKACHFCSREDEEDELSGRVPIKEPKCDCSKCQK